MFDTYSYPNLETYMQAKKDEKDAARKVRKNAFIFVCSLPVLLFLSVIVGSLIYPNHHKTQIVQQSAHPESFYTFDSVVRGK